MLFDMDVAEFTSVVNASTASMMDSQNTERRDHLYANMPKMTEAAHDLYLAILTPVVQSAYMQHFVGEIREKFQGHDEIPDCLSAFGGNDAVKLSAGQDGVVYKLPDGTIAKLTLLRTHVDHPIPDPYMASAKYEVDIATRAGKLGVAPKVRDSFFCCSSRRCYSVIIMDMINGPTLTRWSRNASTDEQDAMMQKLTASLKKLHAAGIVHADLHSNNVMVGEDGEPLIIDFGRSFFMKEEGVRDIASIARTFHHTPGALDELVELVLLDLVDMHKIRIR
jgi:serine/threonine protein kinase